MSEQPIKINHHKSNDYKTSYCTGAFGGISTNGIFEVNFFTDRLLLPDSEVNIGGENHAELPITTENYIVNREFQFGVFLDLKSAKTIAIWLSEQIEKYEKVKQA